jgi:hypothetical protein
MWDFNGVQLVLESSTIKEPPMKLTAESSKRTGTPVPIL